MNRNAASAWFDRAWRGLLLGLMTLFVVNIAFMIAAVATISFAKRWLGTWLPEVPPGVAAWKEFQLDSVLWVTVEVVFAWSVDPSIGASRVYACETRFPGKRFWVLLFLLPLMVPPITYNSAGDRTLTPAGEHDSDVILANLIRRRHCHSGDDTVHRADRSQSRVGGSRVRRRTGRMFWRILGAARARIWRRRSVLVRTIALFELTFLTAGPDSQTLVVALYYAVFAACVRRSQWMRWRRCTCS
jgi:putative spermidine/putrescine transport system permease protein